MSVGASVRADYVYDGKSRLASRVTTNQIGAGTVRYVYDHTDGLIAEVNSSGQTLREYLWLDDLPVAVNDGSVNMASPTLHYVEADHLNRPVRMTNATKQATWNATYEPFGAVHAITGPAANDNRFPGQLFQLEAGLAYNWHRHYDATLGRYTQPDPMGLRTLLSDGPSVYGYAGQSPLMWVDPTGLDSTNWFNNSGGRNPFTNGPTNGNWGGGCWSGGAYYCTPNPKPAPPLDSGDDCYMGHDLCYDTCGPNKSCKNQCDRKLVKDLRSLNQDPRKWPRPPRQGTERDSASFGNKAINIFGSQSGHFNTSGY